MAITYQKRYDVIVVGGGHAGIEAALAGARLGCQTLLLTANADTIGQMSCNPAIGGQAKGHLVREVDALGGEMAKATDMTGIQFRMLNTKKGRAVWAPRAQCDKKAYQARMKFVCEREPNLDLHQARCTGVIGMGGEACGVETSLGVMFLGSTVIIAPGTFVRGLIHIGSCRDGGGRFGEAAVIELSDSLRILGIEFGRFKTGTPPRVLRRTIDFKKIRSQEGDSPIPFFTFWKGDLFHVEHSVIGNRHVIQQMREYPPGSILERAGGQIPCFVTRTTKETAEVVSRNLNQSPLYSGTIKGIGPRYCPSIEDKIVKFPTKDFHQIFLEPEGVSTDEFYVNGLSTSLPVEVQSELIKTVIGCENASILRPAYAVEYDFAFPTQLLPSLECRVCKNLYLAGQINGTSGYEEAAAQGIMAGINAARKVKGCDPIILRRDQAYIGILIDDLVNKGTNEPYRMFTSRAEYRLMLRQDNADLRLAEIGHQVGLLSDRNFNLTQRKRQSIQSEIARLETIRIGGETLAQLLKRPELTYWDLPNRDLELSREVTEQVEIEIKYAGYLAREQNEVARFKTLEEKPIPSSFDYSAVVGLRTEARQKLARIRPSTLGQAARISGVSPADISLLIVKLKRDSHTNCGGRDVPKRRTTQDDGECSD